MAHLLSPDDRAFVAAFEAGALEPQRFDHRAHLRLAYAYLVDADAEGATARMRAALLAFLRAHGIPPAKYHATLTGSWILAVRHFMGRTPDAVSADAFLDANPRLLDRGIMRTHYSAERLESAEARVRFVEPDLAAIPGG